MAEREAGYGKADIFIETDNLSPQDVAKRIFDRLSSSSMFRETSVTVELKKRSYEIVISERIDAWHKRIAATGFEGKLALVTDDNVAPLYLDRVSNDLTQEELASRCELTKGFLSQLENNLATPSLLTLMDIVEALGTTMAIFFTEEEDEQLVFDKDDFFVDESGDVVITYIVPNAQKNQMEPIIIELQPDSRSNIISPKEDGETFGYVIKGSINLVNGKNTYRVKQGGTFYLKCKKEHYLENKTKKIAKVLWICTPPLF